VSAAPDDDPPPLALADEGAENRGTEAPNAAIAARSIAAAAAVAAAEADGSSSQRFGGAAS
jgi:hypothetical protein